jgi:hypothetical protein
VTAIDAEAIVRNAHASSASRRSRLLSWFGGEDTEPDEVPAPPGSLAPPPPDVRREILRLELEADIANLQAEADSITAEAAVEAGDEGRTVVTSEAASDATTEVGAAAIEPTAEASPVAEAAAQAETSESADRSSEGSTPPA